MLDDPQEWDTDAGQLGHIAIKAPTGNKVWIRTPTAAISTVDSSPTG